MVTSRSVSSTPGNGRSTAAFIALKIVVTAPHPSAMTNTITTVKTGALRSTRRAKRRSERRDGTYAETGSGRDSSRDGDNDPRKGDSPHCDLAGGGLSPFVYAVGRRPISAVR